MTTALNILIICWAIYKLTQAWAIWNGQRRQDRGLFNRRLK